MADSGNLRGAAMLGRVDEARRLLDRGFAVDEADRCGQTALYLAVRYNHVDVARLLLDRGADANRPRQAGWVALHSACEYGHVEAGRLLLDRGAEVDRAKRDGMTPLYTSRANILPAQEDDTSSPTPQELSKAVFVSRNSVAPAGTSRVRRAASRRRVYAWTAARTSTGRRTRPASEVSLPRRDEARLG